MVVASKLWKSQEIWIPLKCTMIMCKSLLWFQSRYNISIYGTKIFCGQTSKITYSFQPKVVPGDFEFKPTELDILFVHPVVMFSQTFPSLFLHSGDCYPFIPLLGVWYVAKSNQVIDWARPAHSTSSSTLVVELKPLSCLKIMCNF